MTDERDPTVADGRIVEVDPPRGLREAATATALRTLLRVAARPRLSPSVPVPRQRRTIERLTAAERMPRGVAVDRGTAGGVPGEGLRRREGTPIREGTLLHLHGGAFCIGSPGTHRALAAQLAFDTGLPVFVPDYRLAPEHPWPAALDDARAAYADLAARGPVLLSGDSAGGALALLLAQHLRDTDGPAPAALLLHSPLVDLTLDGVPARVPGETLLSLPWMRACLDAWRGPIPANDPRVSPWHGALAGLPRTLVQWGEDEVLDGACDALVRRMQADGVPVRGERLRRRWHVSTLHPGWLASARAALSRVARFALAALEAATPPVERRHDVVVLGAGMSGLCMVRALKHAGRHDVVVLEKQPGLGGTWWDNTYPGAQVDVPAPVYAFSFAPNPDWTQRFADAPEIQRYQQALAEREGLLAHLRLGVALVDARWDEAAAEWVLRTGKSDTLRARWFVASTGPLNQPRWPDLPGLADFTGPRLHSARWDAAVPLDGRRIGVIGSGSTAVQLIPPLAARAARLVVFQRTANWILPRLGRRYLAIDRWLARVPPYAAFVRRGWAGFLEGVRGGFDEGTFARRALHALAHGLRRWQVRDPNLRAALTPDHPLGCKRLIFSNDYHRAMARPHVALETTGIAAVTRDGVRLVDGREHALDVLVCATGFDTEQPLASVAIAGRGGRTLREAWRDGPEAYHGISVAGFPNLFLLLGPNTATGHTSTLLFIEPAVDHALACMALADAQGARAIEVDAAAMAGHNAGLQARLGGSVWAQCRSWYRAANGRVVALFPGRTAEYVAAVRADPAPAYRLHNGRGPEPGPSRR